MMNFEEFSKSTSADSPPNMVSPYLKALWYDAKGDWENAHNIIQEINDQYGAWIHAYLHRKEGETWNADYWYSKARKSRPVVSLEKEWEMIVKELI